ncbi:MAG: hypothetical protein ACXVZM_06515, partial [Terriglobales bacterium]
MHRLSISTKQLTLAYLALIFFVTAFATAQQRPALTMEWALGDPGANVAKVPKALWLPDGAAIVYNERQPKAERNFERFDPATGQRRS